MPLRFQAPITPLASSTTLGNKIATKSQSTRTHEKQIEVVLGQFSESLRDMKNITAELSEKEQKSSELFGQVSALLDE